MTKTIIIVEDNEPHMRLFDKILKDAGYQTILSRDGRNILQIAKEERPELILMDIQLPQRSGLEITRDLKADKELKHIPVIAVTAFAMKGDESKIREAGCDDYISKPISVSAFLETVAKHLSLILVKTSSEGPDVLAVVQKQPKLAIS